MVLEVDRSREKYHTRRLVAAGMRILWADDLFVWDLETELGAKPWK